YSPKQATVKEAEQATETAATKSESAEVVDEAPAETTEVAADDAAADEVAADSADESAEETK
ncbi:MAG: 50S ribosomal protein L17, partial [Brevibacterium sp.]|nr:50S ribosomal protein L17 [Brevibacterium sp.]